MHQDNLKDLLVGFLVNLKCPIVKLILFEIYQLKPF